MSTSASDVVTRRHGVLFADVADSSRLYQDLGDRAARDIVLAALALARSVVERDGGRVVDRIGDELFCLFPDADTTLRAALGIQERIGQAREAGRLPQGVAFRIGFVHGPVELAGLEVFGDSVYLAKRVASVAKAEQVLTVTEKVAALSNPDPERFLVVDRVRLKGRVDEVDIVEALWGTAGTALIPDVPLVSSPEVARELRLSYDGREVVVSRKRPHVMLGRSASCELVIDMDSVSRFHARVELSRDGFVLVDQSRNGTIVGREGHEPRKVLRARAPLEGAGTLRFGSHEGAPVVTYSEHPVER